MLFVQELSKTVVQQERENAEKLLVDAMAKETQKSEQLLQEQHQRLSAALVEEKERHAESIAASLQELEEKHKVNGDFWCKEQSDWGSIDKQSCGNIVGAKKKFSYRTLLIEYCSVLSPHVINTSTVPDDGTTAVPSWNAFKDLGVVAIIYILWMADFGKEAGACSWLPETFVLFPSKWSTK